MVQPFIDGLKEYWFLIVTLVGFGWRVEHRVNDNARRIGDIERDRLEDRAEVAERRAEDNAQIDRRFEDLRKDMDRRFNELRDTTREISGDIKQLLRRPE